MVDRKCIVDVLNRMRNHRSRADYINDAKFVLKAYCLEHNKKEEDVDRFIDTLVDVAVGKDTIVMFPTYLVEHCSYALDYYKVKFNICELKKDSEIILYY